MKVRDKKCDEVRKLYRAEVLSLIPVETGAVSIPTAISLGSVIHKTVHCSEHFGQFNV
jgi:hypothetical protein